MRTLSIVSIWGDENFEFCVLKNPPGFVPFRSSGVSAFGLRDSLGPRVFARIFKCAVIPAGARAESRNDETRKYRSEKNGTKAATTRIRFRDAIPSLSSPKSPDKYRRKIHTEKRMIFITPVQSCGLSPISQQPRSNSDFDGNSTPKRLQRPRQPDHPGLVCPR